jgi:hypothetical protein
MDGGNLRSDRLATVITFVNPNSEPYFENNQWSTVFTENSLGLEEMRLIPEAIDAKNIGMSEGEEMFQIYYYIDGK